MHFAYPGAESRKLEKVAERAIVMNMELALETVVEELKALPPSDYEDVVHYIHAASEKARQTARVKRKEALEATFGVLDATEADDWEEAINECRSTTNESW